jgi:large subunit ribosomal protein L14
MIQQETMLDVADNTGAKRAQCIRVLGSGNRRSCGVGDVIVATIKKATPHGAVKKSDVVRAVIVRRDRKVLHPLYKKYVRRSTRFTAHDEDNTAHLGDEVEIVQTRPISKTKRWRLVRVVRAAPGAEEAGS